VNDVTPVETMNIRTRCNWSPSARGAEGSPFLAEGGHPSAAAAARNS